MKNLVEGFNITLDQTEERISKLEDRVVESLNQRSEKEKRIKK